MKLWATMDDGRVCGRCAALNGQIVPDNQPFHLPDGDQVDGPFHVGCRCRIYRIDDNTDPTDPDPAIPILIPIDPGNLHPPEPPYEDPNAPPDKKAPPAARPSSEPDTTQHGPQMPAIRLSGSQLLSQGLQRNRRNQ